MKDLIWDIAKSGEDQLENTDLQTIEEPKELFVARGVSLEAKDSTYKINKFVDNKIALDVQDKGAIKISDTVFSNRLKDTRYVLLFFKMPNYRRSNSNYFFCKCILGYEAFNGFRFDVFGCNSRGHL